MDIKTAERAALKGLPVTVRRPGMNPIKYSHIKDIILTPKNGRFIMNLRLADMVQGVTETGIENVEITEE